jgi:RimJ/RimL family protein N-acetyltransferase
MFTAVGFGTMSSAWKALVRTQMALECIELDEHGLMVRIPGPDPDEIPRVVVYWHGGDCLLYFKAGLPPAIREAIHALGPEIARRDTGAVKALLARDRPCNHLFAGQTYVWESAADPTQFPEGVRLTEAHRPLIEVYHPGVALGPRTVCGVIIDGQIVSTCSSSRENERAGEAYVYTRPECRGRGYGRQATAAWAYYMQEQGKLPFYSHRLDNLASQGVARSLNLQPCFCLVAYV